MKAFGASFGNKSLPMHYYLGLDERVNPLDEVAIDGLTFYQACAASKGDIVFAFLLSGFDVNANEVGGPNGYGYTGLHYAAAKGDAALVHLMCDQGAKADCVSTNGGITPLMLCFAGGHTDCCRTLIQHGADPSRPDGRGDPALFYAAKHPVVMHVAKTLKNIDLSNLKNSSGETLLFAAARERDGRHAVLYLCEMGGVDVNARSESTGETALHAAARVNDVDVIKAFMAKGANANIASNAGATPITQKGSQYGSLMQSCSKESNPAQLERMTRPDVSNYARIDMTQIKHFMVAFTLPNILLYIGAHLPAYIGCLALMSSAVGFTLVAKFALSQKGRSLATAGWFSGALTFGSYVLVSRVFPIFEMYHENGSNITALWWFVTACMYISYARAVLADPGAVQSNAEMRKTIIEAVAKEGEAAVKREHFDMTSFVRKPLRSKHCSKTHYTVCRFDHYCVWTGNAIGGGNHRPFVHYCAFQTVSQILVAFTTLNTLWYYGPQHAKVEVSGFLGTIDWMFTPPDNTLITYFLVFYNSFVFLFVSTVVLSQLWYATRNVTSNEVWFATRYSWMFQLGSRAYSMYDKGTWENLKEFFWTGNLVAVNFTVPKMNEYLATITRQHAAKIKSQQAGAGAHGHSHGGHSHGGDVPSAIGSADEGPGSATSVHSDASWHSAQDGSADPSSPEAQQEQLTEMQMMAPKEKHDEVATLQGMLQQLIGGAAEPTVPAHITDAKERESLVRKVKMMHKHYAAAARQAGSPAGKSD